MAEQPQPQEPQPLTASVVIVSHNRAALLRRCLESLERAEGRETLEVVVVDNGSTDGAAHLDDDFPNTQFVRLPKNFGLTKALNIGIRAANTQYILLLHDDTEVEPPVVRLLVQALEASPDAGAVCPLLVDASGAPAPQLGNLPPDDRYRPASPGDGPAAVTYARGAAIMFRGFFFRAMRQIDERYGQFGADADLAQQVRRGAKKTMLVPQARVRHHGRTENPTIRRADMRLGRAAWTGKYLGFGAGLLARLGAALQPVAEFQLGEARYTFSGQKIDGTQE